MQHNITHVVFHVGVHCRASHCTKFQSSGAMFMYIPSSWLKKHLTTYLFLNLCIIISSWLKEHSSNSTHYEL